MTTLTESKIKRHIKSVETAILTGQDLKTLGLSLSLADGKGLVLKRRGTGSWLWLYRFRINGKENNQSFGIYPEVSLDEARDVNDTLKLSHLPRSMFKKRGVKVSHC